MNIRLISRVAVLGLVCFAVLANYALAERPTFDAARGSGRVFFPNPVATLQDQSLTDQKDKDYEALQPAYRTVTLTDLDGSG